ncbi:MAG TPA: DUF2332 domain-containing protein [Solirubrobacteraceae bacterium]|nr:DUF2332 domain-containing protein [Solirubrobacteraceae bacterium]
MSASAQPPYAGAGDSTAGGASLADRFRRHAEMLVRSDRSPLYIHLMRAAAENIDAGGEVARLFEGIHAPPGAVPQLRFVAALHYLVLSGQAPALAAFYPSAGGERPPDDVWPVVLATIEEHFEQIQARLRRTVQTNEPGRSAVLFAGLLWLADRHRRPIRLLEVGASAGLNLIADRYSYAVDGRELGNPDSPLRFVDPWMPAPPIDLAAAAARLQIVARAGCDVAPLDPRLPDDQLTLLAYIWPDELHRIERLRAALAVAARDPVPVVARAGSEWLRDVLADGSDGELVVVWHSVMRQYVEADEWAAIERALGEHPGVVRLSMEPAYDRQLRMQLTVHDPAGAPETRLAVCDDHGLPIRWEAAR